MTNPNKLTRWAADVVRNAQPYQANNPNLRETPNIDGEPLRPGHASEVREQQARLEAVGERIGLALVSVFDDLPEKQLTLIVEQIGETLGEYLCELPEMDLIAHDDTREAVAVEHPIDIVTSSIRAGYDAGSAPDAEAGSVK